MKKLSFFLLLFAFCCSSSIAQSDTIYRYFDSHWKVSSKDSAFYLATVHKSNGLFIRRDFNLKTKSIQMDGGFTDSELRTRQGVFKWYYSNGVMRDSIMFNAGDKKAEWHFYKDGKRMSAITFKNDKVTEQKGWDENGNEIANWIYAREALFPGGREGWKKFLERNLNANIAADDMAPKGSYMVIVNFEVDEDGNIRNIKPIGVPPQCPSCGAEAVRIMKKSPKWIPAVRLGKPVVYASMQSINFQVNAFNNYDSNTPDGSTSKFHNTIRF